MLTFKPYGIGFLLSLAFTIGAYEAVITRARSAGSIVLFLAFTQLFIQLIFFLHIHTGADRQWNTLVFFSTAGIIFIVVAGSLWIMGHLNYNMMPSEMESTLMKMEHMTR